MIDWTKVTVGETVLLSAIGSKFKVVGLVDIAVWLKDLSVNEYVTYSKDRLGRWTIYDPWVEITEKCEFLSTVIGPVPTFEILYKGQVIRPHDPRWKVGKGLRVWMRKEGEG